MSGRSRRVLPLAALVLLQAACGEDGSTEPESTPARLVALSPAVDTVFAGEAVDPPISVRVESAMGDPVEGIPVRFLLLGDRGGQLDAMSVSNQEGIAEADFRAPNDFGEVELRVDIPSASHVPALEFRIAVVPVTSVTLTATGGDGQTAEVASQLPRPFTLRVGTPGGTSAGGVAIAWRVEGAGAGAALTADTSFTDAEGASRTLLTLGTEAREYVVSAHAAGGVASDTVRFTATATTAASGAVRLDSVRPLPLRAGEEALAFGAGFRSEASANEMRVEGDVAEILEAAPDRLRFQVPDFEGRCLPARTVGVRVLAGAEASNGELLPLEPAEAAVSLEVGQAATVEPGELGCVQLPGAEAAREYWLAVQSASQVVGATTSMRLVTRSADDLGFGRPAAHIAARRMDIPVRSAVAEGPRPDLTLRANALRELRRARAAPSRRGRLADREAAEARGGISFSVSPPAVGDTLRFTFPVASDLTLTCSDTSSVIRGVVRASGEGVALVEDVEAPPDGFGEADWSELRDVIEAAVFPADTAYFGPPADIDANGRVLLVFTPRVNRLTPRGSETALGGFFLPIDLAAAEPGGPGVPGPDGSVCPASNEGELLYLAVADPEGREGDPIDVGRARRNARGLTAHELQHLINAERRVFSGEGGFERTEEVWLDEGLSQLAEEVAGLRAAGFGPGENLRFAPFAGSRSGLDNFNTYHIANFFHLSLFMLDPAGARTLSLQDPGGLRGLQMRGFAWGLLRWMGDQEGAGDERLLFRDLVAGGPNGLRGVANIERATGASWPRLLADFVVALALDDGPLEPASSRHRIETWDLRDVYEGLNENPSSRRRFPLPFPLALESLAFESAAVDFELSASAVKYFVVRGGATTPPVALRLGSPAGGDLPEAAVPRITIVRMR